MCPPPPLLSFSYSTSVFTKQIVANNLGGSLRIHALLSDWFSLHRRLFSFTQSLVILFLGSLRIAVQWSSRSFSIASPQADRSNFTFSGFDQNFQSLGVGLTPQFNIADCFWSTYSQYTFEAPVTEIVLQVSQPYPEI